MKILDIDENIDIKEFINTEKNRNRIANIKIEIPQLCNKSLDEKAYSCNPCGFESNNLNDFKRHNQTKKHSEIIMSIISAPKKTVYICKYCDCSYELMSSLNKHKSKCTELKRIKDNNEKDIEINTLNEKIVSLKERIESLEKILILQNKEMKEMKKI